MTMIRKSAFGSIHHLSRRSYATVSRTSSAPAVIRPSTAEVNSGRLVARNLETAVRHLYQDGLVVVEDVVPQDHLDRLNTKMVQDARILQSRGDKGPFNYNKGNLQQDAPPVGEHFYPSIFANRIGTQITSTFLGPRPKWTFCSGNTAMPPLPDTTPQRQPVHSDADFAHPAYPFALVVNVPLVSMTPQNGSTEIWLGTHNNDISAQEGAHGDRASGRIKLDLLEKQRAICPPVQPTIKKRSIIIRDLRLWHAGMPNNTDEVRVMLAMIHFAPWYRNQMRLEFGEDVKSILEREDSGNGAKDLEIPVDYISVQQAQAGYLDRGFGNSYDFDQRP